MPRRLGFAQLSVQEQPLVYCAVAFIVGELSSSRFASINLKWLLISTVALFVVAVALVVSKMQQASIITAILLMICALCGGLLWSLNQADLAHHRVRKLFEQKAIQPDEPVEIWGTINAAPELAPDRIYLDFKVERISTFGKEQMASGLVHLVVPVKELQDQADFDALQLAYGTRLRALAMLRKAHGYRNPGATDFDELLEYRGYDAKGLIKSPLLIEPQGQGSYSRVLGVLYQLRAQAIAVTLRSFKQPTSGTLAAALFGNQYFLSQETAESFRIGGTFHLLVISGLHVAMIALVILWLTAPLKKRRALQFTIVLALLWAYALMVGAQPAITRATVMLTFVLAGQLIYRTAPGANTLAAAALTLLIWQPRDLFNPAFQLSFLAVLMIVLVTIPLLDRLRHLGEWQPSALTPYPPRAPRLLKWCAEVLHWNEAEFQEEMRKAPIKYRLEKARAARWLSASKRRVHLQQSIRWIALTLLATSIIQFGMLPVMIAYFHRVSLVSPVTNALQSALMFVLMIAGAAYLLLYSLVGSVMMKLAFVVNWLGWLAINNAHPLVKWRKLNFRVPDYGEQSAWWYAAYFALLLVLVVALSLWNPFTLHRRITEKLTRRIIVTALTICTTALISLAAMLIWHPQRHKFEPGRLSVTFLDVGQGDGIVITFPNGKLILLDSGGRIPTDLAQVEGEEVFVEDRLGVGEAAVAPYLWQRGIKHLDYIAASHGHSDHVQGFEDIGKSFSIGAALTGVIPTDDVQFESFRQAAMLSNVPLQSIARGDRLALDGVQIEVLTPFRDALRAEQAANNQSLILRLRYGNRVFLLTGDIEKQGEARLVAANGNLNADVLKVAHHGSRSSSTMAFLQRVKPEYAVISVAHPSPFDHPHAETMASLQQIGTRILQTSQCGTITISTDGNDLQVQTFVKCE